ncbi:class C sortase [Clostridium perfringens]
MSKKNNKLSLIFSFLIFFIGASIFFYTTISDLWNKHVNNQLEVKYSEKISKENTVEKDRILNKAIEYNKQHLVNMVKDVFSNNEYSKDNLYYSLLNPNNDGVMGILEIPKINQKLIIWHGVGKEALENGCGHIEGTSIPVGGEGTHAVLASHSGFTNARLFTDLDKLKEDDLFYIQVLDKKLEYKVDKISVVLPSDLSQLAIEKGEDLVTLVTCTPYGVNSHRLLVRGKRVNHSNDYRQIKNSYIDNSNKNKKTYISIVLIAIILIVIITIKKIVRNKSK